MRAQHGMSVFLILLLLSLFIYLFILQLYAIWPFTIDDMYITLRYAKNWAEGFGIVWNIGEPPVEGYSNFSFLVLARLALMLDLNPVFFLKSVGVAGLFLTCVAVYCLSRFWFSVRLAFIPCFWILMYRGQIIWTASGLETTIYEALIVFSVVFLFKGLGYAAVQKSSSSNFSNPFYYFVYAGVLLALASMTRPEAPALALLFLGILYFTKKMKVQAVFLLVAAFLICFLPYFIWRCIFFGHLFPNSVYCKGLDGQMAFMLDKQYFLLIWPFVLLSIPAIYKSTEIRHYFLWLPSVLYSVLLINASNLVAFDNRFFLPAFVLLLPLSLKGIEQIRIFLFRTCGFFTTSFITYCVAIVFSAFFIPAMTLKGYYSFSQNPLAGERLREQVLEWLEYHTHSNDRVVLADSGMIPYRSSLRYIDSYCLNNLWMTQISRVDMYSDFCKYVSIIKPEVIVLTSLIKHDHIIYTPADACLIQFLKVSRDYTLQKSLRTGDNQSMYRYDIYTH